MGTKEFAQAVIANLGSKPNQFSPVSYRENKSISLPKYSRPTPQKKDLLGVDLFVHWNGYEADELAKKIKEK